MEQILTFAGVGYRYGERWAVQGFTAALPSGITGLLGANGAGKTTLMRLAMGLLSPTAGSVRLLGADPVHQPEQRLRVGYLPQHFDPPRWMRVRDYVESLTLLAGRNMREARTAVSDVLERVGLAEYRLKPLSALSGGMLRRVGIAQALAHDPHLLMMDEPAAGLDPEERMRLNQMLRELAESKPVLVSTHMVDEIEREADNIWMMRRGNLVWAGAVREALESVRGKVREGILPPGVTPTGRTVTQRPVANGTQWRVVGGMENLPATEPTLLDAYIHYMNAGEEEGQ